MSAYANYGDGDIIFGVNDSLKTIGIDNPSKACLDIENQITDSIKPMPNYSLRINNDKTIVLHVKKGHDTPYRYNGKAYIKNDSSTLMVDSFQERRLILEGENMSYEKLPSRSQKLSFNVLKSEFEKKMNFAPFSNSHLKTLGLFTDVDGHNNAAELLADVNSFPGIDIVIFGNNINELKRRFTFENVSLIEQYHKSLEVFENEYTVERIKSGFREKYELVPYVAFREALSNAIIHRTYDMHANTKIEMHPSFIKISSPGSIPSIMSKGDFLQGSFSYLRNPLIAEVFNRLNIVEKFATGIRRIKASYENELLKPSFEIEETSLSIYLPLKSALELTKNEKIIYDSMQDNIIYSTRDLSKLSGFLKNTLLRNINSLIEKGLAEKQGEARAPTYIKK